LSLNPICVIGYPIPVIPVCNTNSPVKHSALFTSNKLEEVSDRHSKDIMTTKSRLEEICCHLEGYMMINPTDFRTLGECNKSFDNCRIKITYEQIKKCDRELKSITEKRIHPLTPLIASSVIGASVSVIYYTIAAAGLSIVGLPTAPAVFVGIGVGFILFNLKAYAFYSQSCLVKKDILKLQEKRAALESNYKQFNKIDDTAEKNGPT
jgi:hypothetical protein